MGRMPSGDDSLDGSHSHEGQGAPIIDVTNLENGSSNTLVRHSGNSLEAVPIDDNTVSSVDTSMIATMTTFEDSIPPGSSFADEKTPSFTPDHYLEQMDSALGTVKSASVSSNQHSINKQSYSSDGNEITASLSADLAAILDTNTQTTAKRHETKSENAETRGIVSEKVYARHITKQCSDEFLMDALGLHQDSIDTPHSSMDINPQSNESRLDVPDDTSKSTIRDDDFKSFKNLNSDSQAPSMEQTLSTDFFEALDLFTVSNSSSIKKTNQSTSSETKDKDLIPSTVPLHYQTTSSVNLSSSIQPDVQSQHSIISSTPRTGEANEKYSFHHMSLTNDQEDRSNHNTMPLQHISHSTLPTVNNHEACESTSHHHSYYQPTMPAFDARNGKRGNSFVTPTRSLPKSCSSADDSMNDNSYRLVSDSIEINPRGSLFEFVPSASLDEGSLKSSAYSKDKPNGRPVPRILPPPPPSPTINRSIAANVTNTTASWSPATGGRLWRLAGEIAKQQQVQQQQHQKELNRKAQMWTQTLLVEQMRSRADVDALVAPPTPPRPDHSDQMGMLARLSEHDEEFLLHTGLFANKRVRVVQLLMIGLVGILFGWLGNFFVSSSCYFASINVAVGENGDRFSLHFGLWNYSPVDSALNGFKYCYPYGGSHVADAPIASRVLNLAALLLGTYSLIILWIYLVTGYAIALLWRGAVYAGIVAGMCQLLTLHFFFGTMCRSKECDPGPGAITAIFTAAAWVILGAELHYNCPISTDIVEESALTISPSSYFTVREETPLPYETPSPLMMTNLEMADIAGASNEFLKRFKKKKRGYIPPEFS